jgi:hypothetical protein
MFMHTYARLLLLSSLIVLVGPVNADDPSHHATAESYRNSGYRYFWTVIQDEFDARSIDDPENAQRYREMVDTVMRIGATYAQPYQNSGVGMTTLYPEILKLDPEPPLYVQYRYHNSQAGPQNPENPFEVHARALMVIAEKMEAAEYPKYISGATWLKASEFLREAEVTDTQLIIETREHGIELLVESASLDEIEPAFQEFVAIRIAKFGYQYSALLPDDKVRYCKLLLEDERVDPWVARFASGNLRSDLGWAARGDGWARDVTRAQWKVFEENLKKAEMHLTKAWELRPQWPEAAEELISITNGYTETSPSRDEAFWFNEVISARIDDEQGYIRFANALKPRWGGSIESMYALMDFVVGLSDEHDHMGYIMLEMMAAITRELEDGHAVLLNEAYLTIATRMMREEISDPLPYKNKWQLRAALRIAAMGQFKSGNYASSAQLLRAGGGMTKDIFNPWAETQRFTLFAPVLATPESDLIIKGLVAQNNGDPKGAKKAFKRALKSLKRLKKKGKIDPEIVRDPISALERIIETT